MAHIVFITSGLEHLGVAALSAYLREHGHQTSLVYEPKPFSSNSGPDNALLAKLLEPPPELTAQRVLARKPDIVAFSSYTVTHQWSVEVARAIKREKRVPIVFGGAHVSGAPEYAIQEEAIDVVVEGEGEGALLDLANCVEKEGFGRSDIPNTWLRGDKGIIKNPLRPLISDLDSLPWADKSGFYSHIPVFEREFYVISRRGCPFRCSFCEYSIFPKQYPGSKPVRRRSVEHLMAELRAWHARGKIRKIFFWDAIFTLDLGWMEEFAEAYSRDIGLPFECYSHPQAMSRPMAKVLKEAGCAMVRIGVQTVNPQTLSEMERKGDAEKVDASIRYLKEFDIDHSVDHIAGLPGEGLEDQKAAIRFYNKLRPAQVYVHWMTYLPGTTAFDRARADGSIPAETAERILRGEENRGFDAPRMLHEGGQQEEFEEISRAIVLFDLLPILSKDSIEWLLESGLYRRLPQGVGIRQALRLVLAFAGDVALRERMRTILLGSLQSAARELPFSEFFQRKESTGSGENWPVRPVQTAPSLNGAIPLAKPPAQPPRLASLGVALAAPPQPSADTALAPSPQAALKSSTKTASKSTTAAPKSAAKRTSKSTTKTAPKSASKAASKSIQAPAKSATKTAPKSSTKTSSKSSRKTSSKSTTKPTPKPSAKTALKSATTTAQKSSTKTRSKPTTQKAPKSSTKSASKSTARTALKSSRKTAPKSTTETAPKASTKTASKSIAKTAPKSSTKAATKSAAKTPSKSTTKTTPKSSTKTSTQSSARTSAKAATGTSTKSATKKSPKSSTTASSKSASSTSTAKLSPKLPAQAQ